MVFYLDLILMLNFVIDYFILYLTGKFQHLDIKRWRISLGALLGALYTLVFFVPYLTIFHVLLSKFLLSILMIWISFGFIHFVRFTRALATFYFVSFMIGGGVFAIQNLLPLNHEIINGIYVSRSSKPIFIYLFIIVVFFIIFLFSSKTQQSMKRKESFQQQLLSIEIHIFDFKFKGRGLVDTGNQLYDPITRKPVMILEANDVPFLPAIIADTYHDGEFNLDKFEQISKEVDVKWLSRLQIVPFRTVSKDMQFILAIRPDKVVIHSENNKQVVQTKVLIGLNYSRLSNENAYQAIIHPELLVS